jgi:hypothetical protein
LIGLAAAQSADFPTLQGDNARSGKNGLSTTSGPQEAFLGWYAAYGFVPADSPGIVDNTDFANTAVAPFTGGPYDYNSRGSASSVPTPSATNNPATTWAYPTSLQNEAGYAYSEARRIYAAGILPRDLNPRSPDYFLTDCIPSSPSNLNDPTQPEAGYALRTFTWTLNTAGINTPTTALFVWLPEGPTYLNGNTGPASYSQRYFVYKVQYSATQSQVYVVDTYQAGPGWCQIGGATTLFPVDPTYNITITLYNTVPRDPNTGLLLELFNGQPLSTSNESQVEQRLVYADAAEIKPQLGGIVSTPTSATLANGSIRVTSPVNISNYATVNGVTAVYSQGTVFDYLYNNYPSTATAIQPIGIPQWSFSPVQESPQAVNMDNSVANLAGGFASQTGPALHQGTDYDQAPISTTGVTATATYQPTLASGTYLIYAYLPGSTGTAQFGTQVEYDIYEGANTTPTKVYVNQNAGGGWVQIGTRAFSNAPATTGNLYVVVTNNSTASTDMGRFAYADAIRFVGGSNLTITSSPIHANCLIAKTPGGTPVATDVVVVADERGVIHCLDATGHSDGTTTEYWSYPSTPDPNNSSWIDPNLDPTKDTYPITGGVYDGSNQTLLAAMPTGFSTSSGLIQRINGADYLYIASSNGRVYCIAMVGRGDYNSSISRPGTTQRVWTYPATYPSTAAVGSSSLGSFTGSVAFANIKISSANAPQPAIFAPAPQGRLFALKALPGTTDGTTSPYWTYPALTSPVIGALASTPAIDAFEGGITTTSIFFGTQMLNDNPGVFYSLNANTGALNWSVNGLTINGSTVPFNDFLASPVTVSQTLLNAIPPLVASPTNNSDTVYAINQNDYVIAFSAANGTVIWADNELGTGATSGLTYTVMNVYNQQGIYAAAPVIVVPASYGHFYGLFARLGDTNIYGYRDAWGHGTSGSVYASTSISNNWLYGGDSDGYLYAFDNFYNSFVDEPGGGTDAVPDNPQFQPFEQAKVRLITEAEYNQLHQPQGAQPTGNGTYAQNKPTIGNDTRVPKNGNYAFDMGETMYLEVYDFPFASTNTSGAGIQPPTVNFTISAPGNTSTTPVQAQQFYQPTTAPTNNGVNLDGYAVIAFPYQPSGPRFVPPGAGGQVHVSISTSANNSNGAIQEIQLNPAISLNPPTGNETSGFSRILFGVANPLAISVIANPGSAEMNTSPSPYTIGFDIDPADPENQINGSNYQNGTTNLINLLSYPGGGGGLNGIPVEHGTTGTAKVYVYDRSLMTLLQGQGIGISVQVDRHDLAWQGGSENVINPIPVANFEDAPSYPNTSLDYPNIARTQVSVQAQASGGQSSNPVDFTNTHLNPPMMQVAGGSLRYILSSDSLAQRNAAGGEVLVPTEFDFNIGVPRFQPPNALTDAAVPDSTGSAPSVASEGYLGRMNIYAETNTGNNTVTQSAYRGLNLSLAVMPDARMSVSTPNVDLGDLSAGSGLNTVGGEVYQLADSSPYFQPFTLLNEGNVNLLDLRLVKAVNNGTVISPWTIPAPSNDFLSYMDSTLDTWSNIDVADWPLQGTLGHLFFQKPRVVDTVPTSLSVNPVQRPNSNLGIYATQYPYGPQTLPNIGVTVPIGMPSGKYVQSMRVVNNDPLHSNEILDLVSPNTYEAYSDPAILLSFNVKESRLTTNAEATAASMADLFNFGALGFSNVQPTAMRDGNGGLYVAWTSDRTNIVGAPTQEPNGSTGPTTNNRIQPWRIYLAGIGNNSKYQQTSYTGAGNFGTPLSDLDLFGASAGSNTWFSPSTTSAAGYPAVTETTATGMFGIPAGDSIVSGSLAFGSPAFPVTGPFDPLSTGGSQNIAQGTIMAFVGEAQHQTGTGFVDDSRIFATVVTTSNGGITAGAPSLVAGDDLVKKGKPAVVQTSLGGGSAVSGMVFYPGSIANASTVYYVPIPASGPVTQQPVPLNFGTGFSSVDSVSAMARYYRGVNTSANSSGMAVNGQPIVELTFGGKLRSRSTDEIFLGRLGMANGAVDLARDANNNINPFLFLPVQSFERLSLDGGAGSYRSRGVYWNPNTQIQLVQQVSGQLPTNLLLNGYGDPTLVNNVLQFGTYNQSADTRVVDSQSGIISYDTRLGGKVYIDPAMGTVKFVSATPSPLAEMRLTYQPRFLRIGQGAQTAYSNPTGMFDNHYVSDPLDLGGSSFAWFTQQGTSATATDESNPDTNIENDRFLFTYDRSASGNGKSARPYMTTMRFGVRLPYPIFVGSNATLGTVTVSGNNGPYQLDPSNGRIYFTALDEDNTVNITFAAADPGTGALLGTYTVSSPVGLIMETPEQAILLDAAINESGVSTFIDPFNYAAQHRPPLTWMFWSSTRNGSPDIYFQTISPELLPRPKGN